tara:strand:- start:77201 stop:77962 length:762 start_codon:yes stop_codon:yes gene_type:complete
VDAENKIIAPGSFFKFKQFTVLQEKNAHKTGTDSVLLACFTEEVLRPYSTNITKILDIGTGTGILAMFSAVFYANAKADAIEIIEKNAQEAKQNVFYNNLKDRITVHHTALQQFQPLSKYDLIISNPPYFENAQLNKDKSKSVARHSSAELSIIDIIRFAEKYLSENGYLAFVVPQNIWEKHKIPALEQLWLFAEMICVNKNSALSIIILSKQNHQTVNKRKLSVRNANGNFSEAFIDLTRKVYLPEAYRGKS